MSLGLLISWWVVFGDFLIGWFSLGAGSVLPERDRVASAGGVAISEDWKLARLDSFICVNGFLRASFRTAVLTAIGEGGIFFANIRLASGDGGIGLDMLSGDGGIVGRSGSVSGVVSLVNFAVAAAMAEPMTDSRENALSMGGRSASGDPGMLKHCGVCGVTGCCARARAASSSVDLAVSSRKLES